MFLFFPFILPLKSYLLSSSCSRIANVRVVEESTPQEKRKRGTAPFVFFFKHPFPFFYLSILNYNRFNDTKKKKKERYRNIVSFSSLFFSFFLTFFFLFFFFTLYYIFIYHPSRSFLRKRNLFSLPMATSQQPRKRDRTKGKGKQKDEILLFSRIFHPLYSSTNKQRRKVDGGKTHNNPSRRSLTLVPL